MAGWIAGAVVGSAVLGAVASNSAANKAKASNQAAIDANRYQGEIATDQYDDYKENYRPLEHDLIDDARNFDSESATETAAGEAQSTVSSQMGLARDRLSRTVGYDPSSAAGQAAAVNLELKGAALGAVAQNQARQTIKDKGYARKLDALGMGKGLVANASTGMANAANSATAIARNASTEANQAATGAGALTSGVVNGLSKVNWGGTGTAGYDKWAGGNSGVVQSTGLSAADLSTAF